MKKTLIAPVIVATSLVLLPEEANAYDDDVKTCWDIKLPGEELFCYQTVKYPLATSVFYDS